MFHTSFLVRSKFLFLFFISLCFFSSAAFAGLGASVTLVTGQPTSINPGEVTQLEITFSNNNVASSITAVAFANNLPGVLPNGLKVAGAATYECTDPSVPVTNAGVGVLTAVVGTQAISLAGGVIPARDNGSSTDGTCIIIIPVTAGSSDGSAQTYNYQIADGAVTGDNGGAVANSGAVNQSINVLPVSLPVVSKSFGSSTLSLGGAFTTLTITVTNSNAITLPDFDITDNFPQLGGSSILQVATPPNSTSTCTGGGTPAVFAPVAGAVLVSATGGEVAANSICAITVDVEARQTNGLYRTAFVTNTIDGASDFSNDLGLVPLDASAQVRTLSPLAVAKSFNNAAIASGQSDTFDITFTNSGNSAITINAFTDSPVDGVGDLAYGLKTTGIPAVVCTGGGVAGTFARTASDFGITQTGNTTIAAGQSCTVTTNFTATAQVPNVPISFTNSIAEGAVGTVSAGIVSQAVSASLLVSDELRVLKTASPSNPAPGNPVRYTVEIQNWSNSVINNVITDDTFTNSQTFLTGTIGGIDFTPSLSGAGCVGLTVTGGLGDVSASFEIATLPARASSFSPGSCTITFYTMTSAAAVDGAVVNNIIGANDVCFNAGATCNGGASNSTSSNVDGDTLSAVKSFSPAGPLAENSISRMTITLTNLSANEITAATISDTLPIANIGNGQLRIATPPNAASTCGAPTITAVAGSTSVTINGATVPARASSGTGAAGTCILQVDVTGAAGAYDNTAVAAGIQAYGNGISSGIGPVNSNTRSITFTSSLSATKTFTPGSVSSGGKSTVIVRMVNSGSIPLTALSLTDPLPAGMVLANPVNAQTTCAGTTSFIGAVGASSIVMNGAEMAGNGTCDVLFDVVATGAVDWVNTIPAGNIVASGGVANQTDVIGTLTFNAPTGVTVAKATNPSTLTFPGQDSELTVTLTNGANAVTGLSFTDYFTDGGTSGANDNGMRIASTPNITTTCAGGIISAIPSGTSFSISGVSMAGGASCTITLNVTSIVIGGITNTIPVGSIQTDQGLTNGGAATTSLTTQGNLGVTKKFTPNIIKPGERSRLRITLFNPTDQPAVNVSALDNLPAGLTVPAGANPTTTCTGASVSAPTTTSVSVSGANMLAASGGVAATCYSEIDVTALAAGDYTNTIPVGGVTGSIGGVSAENSRAATDVLRAKEPVVINKAIGGFTLDAGNPAGFTTGSASRAVGATAPLVISLTNPNVTPITGVSITDTLPVGLVSAQTPATSTTCVGGVVTAGASSSSLTLTGATIPAAGACTVTVQVLSNIAGTYINTIAASAITTFEGVTNEEPTSADILITAPPEISKEFSPAVILAGGTSTMTIYFSNDNISDMTLTSLFTDTLPTAPGNVLIAGVPNISKTCPGAVVAAAGTGSVAYANGATIPAGGCSISVDVTASTAGVYTNNIPAGGLQTDFGNNPDPANAELTVSTLGYISGRVFRDNNLTPNGSFESGTDTVLSGISIELRAGATCSAALQETAITDAAGNYIFTSLSAGTYSVCQTAQPLNTVNGITSTGIIVASNGSTGIVGTDSNPNAITSQIIGIVINGDGGVGEISGSINNNFAEVVQSSISGRIFYDQNNNGIQNGADLGASGVTVELLNAGGAVISTTTTDATGDYIFTNLDPATYSVREPTQPNNSNNGLTIAGTIDNGGTSGMVTIVGVVPSKITGIILPPNTDANDNNFAEIPNGRSITGSVFLDYDNNAVENGEDYGLAGIALTLSGTDVNGAVVSDMVTTDTAGLYSFTNLPEGTYLISQSAQPTGTNNGTTTAGTVGGAASNPTATTSQITGINLTGANTLSAANLFPEIPVDSPDLAIVKTHAPASFAVNSSSGTFTITPRNIGAADTTGTITITDTLPVGLTLATTPSGTGWTCSGSVGASAFTCTTVDVVSSTSVGEPVSFRVRVASGTSGQLLTNQAVISGGGEPSGFDGNNTAVDTVGISTVATVSGTIWRDADHDRILDVGEDLVSGWSVELLLGGVVVDTVITAADGTYTFSNVSPGSGYDIQFREPSTDLIFGNAVTNEQGIAPAANTRDTGNSTINAGANAGNPGGADTTVTSGILEGLTILAGDNIIEQSLPLDPAGIIYDAVTRLPVQNAQITITGPVGFDPAIHLVGGQGTVTTGADGFYQFLLIPGAPVGQYDLGITTYPGGYATAPSTLIPVCNNVLTVNAVPDPALVHDDADAPDLASAIHNPAACPITTAALAPVNQASTQFYFSFILNAATSGDLVNNHIPLDPINAGDIIITKTSPIINTSVGQLVPYSITVRNASVNNYADLDILDTIPAGFKFVNGSGSLDGTKLEPAVNGRSVTWESQVLNSGDTKTYKLILVVGSGVQPGEYINRAQVLGNPGGIAVSNIATATVRVIPDPVFDCSDIIGKVFDDKNKDGYQDRGEIGIANVRIATLNGLLVTTDDHGRFHVACADIPDEERGSNFLMKLDERTLPTGYRITTENPRSVRVTRGKITKLNFGAAIHRVVRIDMQDNAFISGEVSLKPEWIQQMKKLPDVLKSGSSVVRIAYKVGTENIDLARKRLKYVVKILRNEWEDKHCCHEIMVEKELIIPSETLRKGVK